MRLRQRPMSFQSWMTGFPSAETAGMMRRTPVDKVNGTGTKAVLRVPKGNPTGSAHRTDPRTDQKDSKAGRSDPRTGPRDSTAPQRDSMTVPTGPEDLSDRAGPAESPNSAEAIDPEAPSGQ